MNLKLYFVLLLSYSFVTTANVSVVKKFDKSSLSATDRMILYFSEKPVHSFITGEFTYEYVIDQDSEQSPYFLIDNILEANSNRESYVIKDTNGDLDITDIVKATFPQINFDSAPIVNSYNCHNTSLVVNGFLDYQSYSSETEIRFYMDNFCKEVRGRGDKTIGVYYHPMLSHSFTSINENVIFSKASNHMKKPYEFIFTKNKYRGFKHYKCDANKFRSLSCDSLKQEIVDVDEVDKFFSQLVVSLSMASQRSEYYELIKNLRHDIKLKRIHSNDCILIKQSLLERLGALESLYEDLDAGNIYGVGSYGDSGPKY